MSISAVAIEAPPSDAAIEARTTSQLVFARLRSDKMAIVSSVVIVLIVLMAVFAPVIAQITGHGPQFADTEKGLDVNGQPLAPFTNGYLLGTDNLGRDILVRIAFGAQISLLVGLISTAVATVLGVVVGLISGYLGGWLDAFLARIMDVVLSFPYVLLALALAAILHPSVPLTIGVIAFFSWAAIGRIVRSQALSQREKEYVEASLSVGAGTIRVMFIDILPNLVAPVIVLCTLLIPIAIVFEATLSFLGAGVVPPTPSWGNMLSDAQTTGYQSWWFWVFPSLFLLLTTLAFNLIGDSLRDALDPRTERLFAMRRKKKKEKKT